MCIDSVGVGLPMVGSAVGGGLVQYSEPRPGESCSGIPESDAPCSPTLVSGLGEAREARVEIESELECFRCIGCGDTVADFRIEPPEPVRG